MQFSKIILFIMYHFSLLMPMNEICHFKSFQVDSCCVIYVMFENIDIIMLQLYLIFLSYFLADYACGTCVYLSYFICNFVFCRIGLNIAIQRLLSETIDVVLHSRILIENCTQADIVCYFSCLESAGPQLRWAGVSPTRIFNHSLPTPTRT